MNSFSEQFLQYTIEVWQEYYDYPLTLDDAEEIASNMLDLFNHLDDIERTHEKETQL